MLGAECVAMDEYDGPLRLVGDGPWSPSTLTRNYAAFVAARAHGSGVADIAALSDRLRDAVLALEPDELWLPLGLGEHPDHQFARNAALRMLANHADRFSAQRVSFYEDIPYAFHYPDHGAAIVRELASHGFRLQRRTDDVTAVFDAKLRAVSAFASQWKLHTIEPAIRGAADRASTRPSGQAEVSYELDLGQHVSLPPQSALTVDASRLAALRSELSRWRADAGTSARIAVLSTAPFGRWRNGMQTFLDAFPSARFDVFAARDTLWETEAWSHPRIRVRAVPLSRWGWIATLLRELPRIDTPALFVWHGASAPDAPLVRAIRAVRKDWVVCARFGDACLALSESLSSR
jgi:hypothetical protein